MIVPNVRGLLDDVRGSLFASGATLAATYAWIWITGRGPWDTMIRKLSLCSALAIFAAMFPILMYQDRGTLVALWQQHPVGYGFAYAGACALLVGILAAVYYWQLRPALWRATGRERDLREQYARARVAKRRLYRLDGDPPPEDGRDQE